MYTKSLVFFAVVGLVASVYAVDARPKRSVLLAAAPVAAVASVPVVHTAPAVTSTVVHHNPTSVVRTEQVRTGDRASYSYSHEIKTEPVVHQHAVAAAPVVTATHHTVAAAAVPAYHYAAYYPSYAHSYAYSPYSYVIGK